MQIRTMDKACDSTGIYATYQEQIDDGRIGTYAERLAILSTYPPTYVQRIAAGEINPYNVAITL